MLLNQYGDGRVPLLLHTEGGAEQVDFSYHYMTEVWKSCSVRFQGEVYVFGGQTKGTQVSKVSGCGLERIGTLDKNFFYGDCTTIGDQYILLCFDYSDTDDCRIARFLKCNVSYILINNYETKKQEHLQPESSS